MPPKQSALKWAKKGPFGIPGKGAMGGLSALGGAWVNRAGQAGPATLVRSLSRKCRMGPFLPISGRIASEAFNSSDSLPGGFGAV